MKRNLKSKANELFDKTVTELINRGGMFIASFNEMQMDYKLGRFVFDAYIKGNTFLEKTFFLSKIFAFFVTPRYNVICLLVIKDNKFGKIKLLRRIRAIHKHMKETNVKLGWFFIFILKMNASIKKTIQALQNDRIGVVCLDVGSGEIVFTDSILGRQGKKLIRTK